MSYKLRINERVAKAIAVLLVIGGVVAPVASIVAASAGQPRDNNSNSVIWGGCFTKAECLDNMNNGDGHGHSGANITGIMNSVGVTKARLSSSDTVRGTVFKDGRVTIAENFGTFKAGDTVATNSWSLGRDKQATSTPFGSVWKTFNNGVFLSNSIPAFVNMSGGTMNWFVLNSCGNPGRGNNVRAPKPTPVPSHKPTPMPSVSPIPPTMPPTVPPTAPPQVVCTIMNKAQVDNTNTWVFRMTISPPDGQVLGFVWNFTEGTGTSQERTDANTPFIQHAVGPLGINVLGQVVTQTGTTPTTANCQQTVPGAQVLAASVAPATTVPATGGVGQTMPATGPETALGGAAGLTALAYASRAYLRSRKTLLGSLRQPRE